MKRSGFLTRAREPMKRGRPLRRSGRLRAKRVKPGVTGRPSVSRELWEAMKRALWVRAQGRCEHCRSAEPPIDPDHVVPRSAGGEDSLRNLAALCRRCHERKSAPYADGRLVVTMVEGPEAWRPRFQIVFAKDKSMARTAAVSGTDSTRGKRP